MGEDMQATILLPGWILSLPPVILVILSYHHYMFHFSTLPFFSPSPFNHLSDLFSLPPRTYSISYPSTVPVPASFNPYWEAALLSHNLDKAGCGVCTPAVVPLSTCTQLCVR